MSSVIDTATANVTFRVKLLRAVVEDLTPTRGPPQYLSATLTRSADLLEKVLKERDQLRTALRSARESLATFGDRDRQPGFKRAADDSTVTFFCIDVRRARAAQTEVEAALAESAPD